MLVGSNGAARLKDKYLKRKYLSIEFAILTPIQFDFLTLLHFGFSLTFAKLFWV